jgi:hypothetical protein
MSLVVQIGPRCGAEPQKKEFACLLLILFLLVLPGKGDIRMPRSTAVT